MGNEKNKQNLDTSNELTQEMVDTSEIQAPFLMSGQFTVEFFDQEFKPIITSNNPIIPLVEHNYSQNGIILNIHVTGLSKLLDINEINKLRHLRINYWTNTDAPQDAYTYIVRGIEINMTNNITINNELTYILKILA